MIEDLLARGWENFIARYDRPLSFRFLCNRPWRSSWPSARDGAIAARIDQPFLWSLLTEKGRLRVLVQEWLKDTGKC